MERPREENLEADNNPEGAAEQTPTRIVAAAVDAVENREAADSSEWGTKAANFLETTGGVAIDTTRVLTIAAFKVLWGLLKFAGKAIKNKGRVFDKGGIRTGQRNVYLWRW